MKEKKKTKLTLTRLTDFPEIVPGARNTEYDNIFNELKNSPTGTTISVAAEGKTGDKLYQPIHARVLKWNQDPNRAFDVLQRTIKENCYVKSVTKEATTENQPQPELAP
jgi:hypothetical protein